MASYQSRDGGYATPAALIVSLALSLVAIAATAHTLQLLHQARRNLEKTQAEFILDGAHLEAAAAVVRSGQGGPFEWTGSSDLGLLRVRADAEAEKLAPGAAGRLDDELLAALGVVDGEGLRMRIAALSPNATAYDVASLDSARLWRECGAILVSARGRAEAFAFRPAAAPRQGAAPPSWHIGETWRIRIATAAGWRDDRIVRFTGSARHPVAVVWRDLSRGTELWGECEGVLAAVYGG